MTRILYAGSDIREHPARPNEHWTKDRREKYLLRPDVVRPLSVDPNVWGRARGPDGQTSGTPLPWISVEAVIEGVRSWAGVDDGVAIVIGVVAEDPQEERTLARSMGTNVELCPQPTWEFLGFDVADSTTSGLSNCGYGLGEVDVLRPPWASRLNHHGLFAEITDALSFRRLTDERVPEHAPFRVYGIWMLEVDGPGEPP
ncbi:MAG: hypothetical protein HY898_35065 [Deltaproteobacteria bacterium]|nr:hypothetical protein [Deltaproteobacteria bacterium]